MKAKTVYDGETERRIKEIREVLKSTGQGYAYGDRRKSYYRFKLGGLLKPKLKRRIERLGGKVSEHVWVIWGGYRDLVHVIKIHPQV